MDLFSKIKMLSKFPPHIIVQKVLNRMVDKRRTAAYVSELTSSDLRKGNNANIHHRFFDLSSVQEGTFSADVASYHLKMFKAHRFDLLGSGWVENSYGAEAFGLEIHQYPRSFKPTIDAEGAWLKEVVLPAHLDYARSIWRTIQEIDPEYQPIDWQWDFKSGFRWDALVPFNRQRQLMAGKPGVDLKVPWELSRLQHLPQMAICAKRTGELELFAKEYLCQTLDFIMTNPIGMGVNFNCPMDIGIRVANMLLAYDLFSPFVSAPDLSTFEPILSEYIHASTLHIAHDMEYREGLTSNHYLGNVLGILFAGAYLKGARVTDQFLAYGVQELESSMARQFFADGGNFEGSTSYHRLSGEMMAAGAFICLNLDDEHRLHLEHYSNGGWHYHGKLKPVEQQLFNPGGDILTQEFYDKLKLSGRFTQWITKPGGNIPQFGDNDSGRFIRLTPVGHFIAPGDLTNTYENISQAYTDRYDEHVWDENGLDHSPFVNMIHGLFDRSEEATQMIEFSLFSSGVITSSNAYFPDKAMSKVQADLPYKQEQLIELWEEGEGPGPLQFIHFPEFQLSVLKGGGLYLALSGISNKHQHHSMSHVHNDKLHLELEYHSEPVLRDPGTYLYTPIPSRREEFRSVKAHNTAVMKGEEQNTPLEGRAGLFNMIHQVHYQFVSIDSDHVCAEISYRHKAHRRTVKVAPRGVLIIDECTEPFEVNLKPFPLYSSGYGKLRKVKSS